MADRRYVDHEGVQWASRYEADLYWHLKGLGVPVRKCEQGSSDTFHYTSRVVGGRCLGCEDGEVVQDRTYTPDLYVGEASGVHGGGYFVEAKGYWKPPQRNLLRSVVKSHPELNLLFVFQKDVWITRGKSKYSDYVKKYFKNAQYVIWDNKACLLPGEKRGGKKAVKQIDLGEVSEQFIK